jgi:hypothetical protein
MGSEALGHQHIYYKEGNTKVARAALCIHRIHHITSHHTHSFKFSFVSSQFTSAVLLQFNSTAGRFFFFVPLGGWLGVFKGVFCVLDGMGISGI